jgi:hypothetical protein
MVIDAEGGEQIPAVYRLRPQEDGFEYPWRSASAAASLSPGGSFA